MRNLLAVAGIALFGAAATTCGAATPTPYAKALRSVQDNARAVYRNAEGYQYERVEIEVERIVLANKQIQKTLAATPAAAASARELADAVRDLRGARFNSDMPALMSTSNRIERIVATLPAK